MNHVNWEGRYRPSEGKVKVESSAVGISTLAVRNQRGITRPERDA